MSLLIKENSRIEVLRHAMKTAKRMGFKPQAIFRDIMNKISNYKFTPQELCVLKKEITRRAWVIRKERREAGLS